MKKTIHLFVCFLFFTIGSLAYSFENIDTFHQEYQKTMTAFTYWRTHVDYREYLDNTKEKADFIEKFSFLQKGAEYFQEEEIQNNISQILEDMQLGQKSF